MPNSFQTYYNFSSRQSQVRHRTKWPLRDHLDHVPLKPHAETYIFGNKIEPIIGSRVIQSSLLYSTHRGGREQPILLRLGCRFCQVLVHDFECK